MTDSALVSTEAYGIANVCCEPPRAGFEAEAALDGHVLVVVRRGAFVRRAGGREILHDATRGYLAGPGVAAQYAHPAGGDCCLSIRLSEGLVASLTGGDPELDLPDLPLDEASDRAFLHAEPRTGLVDLARRVGCSPHHLSRVFSQLTGSGVGRYRNRVRVAAATERIEAGEPSLAALACELGFADQAHLTRTVRALTGRPPAAWQRHKP